MKEINDFLLNLFTANDDIRPAMMFPNLKDGIVYATDAHVLITIPEEELSLKYETNEKYPNAEKTILDTERENSILRKSIKVKVPDMLKELTKARICSDKLQIKCNECEGSGEVEFSYLSKMNKYYYDDFECPVCEGKGSKDTKPAFARIKLDLIQDELTIFQMHIDIDELRFHPFQLYRLMMVAILKGYEEIEIFYKVNGWTLAYFDNIKVLIMQVFKG